MKERNLHSYVHPIEKLLLKDLAQIIEQGKLQVVERVNSVLTFTYWQIGKRINEHILENKRADYGKKIITSVSLQLVKEFGFIFSNECQRLVYEKLPIAG